ncbi:hypothetical protein AB0D33_13305 [Streptomyces sp. NPDC048404]|uniref:hypothetical protein n=1 Tax=unclassified Streptomyces TaxID=2593676 RepID=UPI0034493A4F
MIEQFVAGAKGVGRAVRGCGGLLRYLTERLHARTAVEMERERNAHTVAVLPLMKPGMDFFESEPGGRTRVIRTAVQELSQTPAKEIASS